MIDHRHELIKPTLTSNQSIESNWRHSLHTTIESSAISALRMHLATGATNNVTGTTIYGTLGKANATHMRFAFPNILYVLLVAGLHGRHGRRI